SACTTNEAKYLPDASLMIVTDEGSDGRSRDQRTDTSPIFGRRSLPPVVIDQRSDRVYRAVCRLSFLDRNRGGATFGPLRLPDRESKKFRYAWSRSRRACCMTPTGASASQARSGVFFAWVMSCLDRSPDFGNGSPALCASCRACNPSLYTTRAHPNVLASDACWPGAG